MSFGMITIVAIVRNIDHSSTKITYTLEDHTGSIDAHLWLEEGDSISSPNVLLNTYARVHGSVRAQGDTKTIMIFKIEPLESLNELTTHLLEVLMTRYKAEDFANNGAGQSIGIGGGNNANGIGGGNHSEPVQSGLQGKQLMIYQAVKDCKEDAGISIQELQKKFSHISQSEL